MIWAFDVATADPAFSRHFFTEALKRELRSRPIGNTVYFMPPYVIDDAELALLAELTRRPWRQPPPFRDGAVRSSAKMTVSRTLLLLLIAFLPLAARAQEGFSIQEAARAAGPTCDAVGVFRPGSGSGRVVLAAGADQALNPASSMKLLTTYAGLEILGLAFTWKTEAWADGVAKGNVLDGNLVRRAAVTPSSRWRTCGSCCGGVRNRGLKQIRGDLVLDRRAFQQVVAIRARFHGVLDLRHEVLDALLFDEIGAAVLQCFPMPAHYR